MSSGEAGDADNESDGFSDIEAPTASSSKDDTPTTTATTTTPPRRQSLRIMAEEKQVKMRNAEMDCNGTNSLQLYVVECDTCLVWELLPFNAQTAPNLPSLKGNRLRH